MKKLSFVIAVILIFAMMLAFSACKCDKQDTTPTVDAVTTVSADSTENGDVAADATTEDSTAAASDDSSTVQNNASDESGKTNAADNNANAATQKPADTTKATQKATTTKYTVPTYTVGGPANDPYVQDIF